MSCHCRKFRRIEKQFRKLRTEVRALRFLLLRPKPITLLVTGENEMAIQFAVVLPVPPEAPSDWSEIASGVLSVAIPGNDLITIETTKAQQETADRLLVDDRFVGAQGAVVGLSFQYIDDAGNAGAMTSTGVELQDTVPPVAPGELGLVATGEV